MLQQISGKSIQPKKPLSFIKYFTGKDDCSMVDRFYKEDLEHWDIIKGLVKPSIYNTRSRCQQIPFSQTPKKVYANNTHDGKLIKSI